MAVSRIFTNVAYEQDPRAMAVDAYTSSHLLPSTKPMNKALEHALQNSVDKGLPDIACYPMQGKFLAVQCRIANAKNVLEIGTLGGYSSIWFASAGSDVHVTSVEVDRKHREVAMENIAFAGLSDRIEVILGAGLDVLPKLAREVEKGKRQKFDFVFIDADKENNWEYFQSVIPMVRAKTCIYVDNVVRKGNLASAEAAKEAAAKGDLRIEGCRKLVENVGRDDRVEALVLQTVSEKNYDGFLMAVVK
jgi:predicted O-methyltransferase YrrM